MSESVDRATRRDLRRAMGASASDLVQEHELAIVHHAEILKRLEQRVRADEQAQHALYSQYSDLRVSYGDFVRRPFTARLRWLLTGR